MITLFIDKAGHFGIATLIYGNFMRIFRESPLCRFDGREKYYRPLQKLQDCTSQVISIALRSGPILKT